LAALTHYLIGKSNRCSDIFTRDFLFAKAPAESWGLTCRRSKPPAQPSALSPASAASTGCPDQRIEASSEAAEKAFEQNVERAQGAMDNYFGFLQNVCGPDLTEKMITYTEQNISASTDCMHKLAGPRIFKRFFAFRLSSCRGK